jgi:hypothetical protein
MYDPNEQKPASKDMTAALDAATKLAQAQKPAAAAGITVQQPATSSMSATPEAAGISLSRGPAGGLTITNNGGGQGGLPAAGGSSTNANDGNAVLARENAIRQSTIDSQRGGVAILGGSGGMGDERGALLKKVMTPHEGAQNGQLTAAQLNVARGVIEDSQNEQLKAAEIAQRGNEAGQRLGLDQQRMAIEQGNQVARLGVDMERFGLDKQRFGMDQKVLAGRMEDEGFVRLARQGLVDSATSKDPAEVNKARMSAIAAGIIKPEIQPKNEYATNVTTNPMGTGVLAITRTNKDTGAVDLIDPATGKVKSFGAGGVPTSSRPVGTRSTVGGKTAVWDGSKWVEQKS